ncbi:hypothetical protein ANCCAN_15798 [Ancylostoma caninum]|uniref:Uncharacterized protein n=1 Tax=Ancylostoma caninum TaxID=29170 RepID=A0A368G1F8_ANCCA|nr:hypothetical protein ANCCAN_15798 [Ancylostoma caninum]
MSTSTAPLEPGTRWNPTKYEIDDYDFQELTEMFAELRAGCGPNFNTYFGFVRKFVMLSMTNYELDTHVKKFLPAEVVRVHEKFVYRLIQICDLPVKTRSLDDILNGKDEDGSKDKYYLPHISTLNALAILYSLAQGWKSPDRKFGELLANAVHIMLRDRIDAALHVRSVPVTNEIGVHAKFQCSSTDGEHSANMENVLTATDFLKSFSVRFHPIVSHLSSFDLSKNHFLSADSDKLLKMRCHSNFYAKLKSAVPEEHWDPTLEDIILNAANVNQKPGVSIEGESCSQNVVVDASKHEGSTENGTVERKRTAPKRPNSTKGPSAKRRPSEKSTNGGATNSLDSSTDVTSTSRTELSAS